MIRDRRISEAEQKVEASRTRLLATAVELQHRLNPRTLAREAWEDAKNKGADLAEEAVDAVKSRPVAAAGIAAAVTMFLAREPIIDAASRLFEAIGDKRAEKKRRKSAAVSSRPAVRSAAPSARPVARKRKVEKPS